MAGKRIEVAELVVTTTDGDTLKIFGQKTKKATKEVDNLGRASQATDRRIKGVTQQSSNATKNFSKQAQTMQGGIVAVYATIAAQVFAVSAAFQFLKDAMETRNLIQGQVAFGSVTGVAYKTLTEDIQKATDGMIQFKEAAQAAAIGTAAGLTAGQMERLGAAAKNTSLALGRDLTDSFNRLVRGVTKAEPELLDELGIVLRLEPAMKAYANQIGKSAKDLTQFEKSQAVANEVLGQAETKFGAIQQVLDPSAFALAQFGKAFDDMMKGVKETVGDIAAVVLPFFSKNIYALVGALTLFLTPILRSILPDFAAMGAAAEENYGRATQAADDAAAAAQRAKAALTGAKGGDVSGLRDKDYMKEHGIKAGKGMPEGQLSKRQLQIRKKHLKEGVGFSKNMNRQELRAYKTFLTNQEIALAGSLGKRAGFIKRNQFRIQAMWASHLARYKKMQMAMVSITAKAAKLMNKAMRFMGWFGIALMIFEAVKALYNWIRGVDEAAEAEKQLATGIQDRYKNLTIELQKMNDVANMGLLDFKGTIEQMGSAFQSVDIKRAMEEYTKALAMDDDNKAETITKITGALKELSELTEEPKALTNLIEAMESEEVITQSMTDEIVKMEAAFGNAATSSKQFAENNKAVINSLRQMAGTGSKLFGSSVLENMQKNIESRQLTLNKAPEVHIRASDNFKRTQQALEDQKANMSYYSVARKGRVQYDEATIDDMEKDLGNIGYFDSDAKDAFKEKYGIASTHAKHTISNARKQLEIQKQLTTEHENTVKVIADNAAQHSKLLKEQEQEKRIVENLLALQERQSQLQRDQIINKFNAIGVGTGTTVADKNAKEELRNANAILDVSDKQLKLDMAAEALRIAKEQGTATEEEIKGLELTAQLAALNLVTSIKQKDQTAEEVALKKVLNKQDQERLELSEAHALNAVKRSLAEKQNEAAIRQAGTHAEVRLLQEEKIKRMEEEKADKAEKLKLLKDQYLELVDQEGHDEEDARKRAAAILQLKQEQLVTEQMITDEINKQNMVDSIAATNRDIDAKRNKLANLKGQTNVGALPGMGFGNITPQAVELNKLLAQQNMTAADAEEIKYKNGKTYLDILKDQATAQAGLNTELELANSTASILQNGFVNMFQAMIDGTKSFGDAMKDVMKQVLADLAAAYMKAAALKALEAIGLPGLPARYGGILSPSGKSFGYGGIAKGPESGYLATLHGNEAVVPLGNDRSIPVELSGGAGNNTVNVSINMNGQQSQTTTEGDPQMQGLGKAIGGLVQQHLQQEMRPGGLLNQQGTKGRA